MLTGEDCGQQACVRGTHGKLCSIVELVALETHLCTGRAKEVQMTEGGLFRAHKTAWLNCGYVKILLLHLLTLQKQWYSVWFHYPHSAQRCQGATSWPRVSASPLRGGSKQFWDRRFLGCGLDAVTKPACPNCGPPPWCYRCSAPPSPPIFNPVRSTVHLITPTHDPLG